MRPPVPISPPIFGSPMFPAPTTRQCLPSSFKNIGNKLLIIFSNYLTFHATRHATLAHIALAGSHDLPSQRVPQLSAAVQRKKAPKISALPPVGKIFPQQPFDRFRNRSR